MPKAMGGFGSFGEGSFPGKREGEKPISMVVGSHSDRKGHTSSVVFLKDNNWKGAEEAVFLEGGFSGDAFQSTGDERPDASQGV
jgi:hypothetical protein